MTLKFRNRLCFSLLIFSLAFFVTSIFLFIIQFFRGAVSFDFASPFMNRHSPFLVRYNPVLVMASLCFEQLFAVCSFYILMRSFTKTQAQNLIFYYLFLLGMLIDTLRFVIPLFSISNTYSALLVFCGDAGIFSSLVIPLSLLSYIVTAQDDVKINSEQLLFSILLLCMFFASIIPLNTVKNLPNFSVDFSFKKTIFIMTILCYITSLVILIISNIKKRYNQITAVGFFLMTIGITALRNAANYVHLTIGIVFSSIGEFMYLKSLHNQYLWND